MWNYGQHIEWNGTVCTTVGVVVLYISVLRYRSKDGLTEKISFLDKLKLRVETIPFLESPINLSVVE